MMIVKRVRCLRATTNQNKHTQSWFWFLTWFRSRSSSTWLKNELLDIFTPSPSLTQTLNMWTVVLRAGRRCVRNLLPCSAYKKGPKSPSGPHSKPSIELHSSARQTARLAVLHPSSRWVDATTTSSPHKTTLSLRYVSVTVILWKSVDVIIRCYDHFLSWNGLIWTQKMDFILKLP